ncbi:low density lipoprotein receptor adapter protein 1-A-like isoform X4 [Cyprinus carpio]|uniref:Low density lipoprotein receptor adapter protein 1-A-like isoform X4 n=1 Tax=Cyprinus carpio TaxID=7962 RepID=A0A9Q9Z631_CYPCA|nr:low density lipoprotein receptor adapter protein 1-A-like isoform X4 [Cyprinus carpio]
MDVLKSARRAFIRSPSLTKQSRGSGKHQKLPENWTDTRETLLEGMTFNLRHLGMTLVDQPKGEELSAAAVKRIVATAKASGKKLPKVALKVSPQGIVLCDSVSNQLIENISIYRISYCTADKMHDKVFAFIAQNQQNETLECHAFFCAKRKVAQAVTLTVAQAFRVAFEFWEVAKEERENHVKWDSAGEASNSSQSERSVSLNSLKGVCILAVATENLLDIDDSSSAVVNVDNPPEPNNNSTPLWEIDDGLEEAFSSCSLDSYEYSPDLLSLVLTPRSWTLG